MADSLPSCLACKRLYRGSSIMVQRHLRKCRGISSKHRRISRDYLNMCDKDRGGCDIQRFRLVRSGRVRVRLVLDLSLRTTWRLMVPARLSSRV